MNFSSYIVILAFSILSFYVFIKDVIGSKLIIAKYLKSNYYTGNGTKDTTSFRDDKWKIKLENKTSRI